ncbi:MAG: SBBP repeat-containing protein [Burkholderiales bacterium]|nr:SBBP repeat-containing protein [Bacteroidia bacterium]
MKNTKANRRSFLFSIILFFTTNFLTAQIPSWQWAKGSGGVNNEEGLNTCVDANGNVYVVGYFQSPNISFGSYTLINYDAPGYSIYIVKYNTLGNVLWAKSASGYAASKAATAIDVDSNGNLYITGYYGGYTITFGSITLTNVSGYSDFFIAKYDNMGNVLWANGFGGHSYEYSQSIKVDINNDILVTGTFYSPSIVFGNDSIVNPNIGCFGDIFIAKFSSAGNYIWAKQAGGYGADQGNAITTDPNGNIYLTGYTRSSTPCMFDTISLTPSTGSGYKENFIAKYSSSGEAIWAKNFGTSLQDEGKSICTDINGNVYITGSFYYYNSNGYMMNLDNNNSIINRGGKDSYLIKYDSLGNILWSKGVGGINYDEGNSVRCDVSGNIYLAGYSRSPYLFIDNDSLLINNGLFIMKYNDQGNKQWIVPVTAGGFCATATANSMCLNNNNDIYITGSFTNPSIKFGNDSLSAFASDCTNDIFIAKLALLSTNVQKEVLPPMFNIYPNPSRDFIFINNIKGKSTITLYDVFGKLFIKKESDTDLILDVHNLPKGLYTIVSESNKENTYTKIIICD